MRNSNPKAILIDVDNTVYLYAPCHRVGLTRAHDEARQLHSGWKTFAPFAADFGAARDSIKRQIAGQPSEHCRLLYFQRLLETQFGRSDLRVALKLNALYWGGYFSKLAAEPGVLSTLNRWRSAGIRLAWVTNFTAEWQMRKLVKLGLDRAVQFLVTSEEAGAQKPQTPPFLLALEKVGVRPGDACFVGDDLEHDILPAQKLGMTTIWIRREAGEIPASLSPSTRIVGDWRQLARAFALPEAA